MVKTNKMETKKSILAYLHDLSILLAVILAAFLLVFRIVVVSGPSMMSTLENGDYLIVINQFFAGNPKQGDIVVISKSTYDNGTPIIKRVIATEGQQVTIRDSKVFVDGLQLDHSRTGSLDLPLQFQQKLRAQTAFLILGSNYDLYQVIGHQIIVLLHVAHGKSGRLLPQF